MRCVLVVGAVVLAAASSAAFAEEAEWIRYPAISPDGKRIAFTYRGDLWVVPSSGGEARHLTTHVGHERSPVWSPDGTRIAFAGDWYGHFDVFVVPSAGGAAERLTWNSSPDVPYSFTPDGSHVVFSSTRQDAPQAAVSSQWLPELYKVPATGGRAKLLLTTPADAAVYSPDAARVLYHDRKSWEDSWRKHHTSSAARDVWLWTLATGEHVKLTDCPGEDRNPAWAADGKSFWYLTERGGSFNVWKHPDLTPGCKPVQVTKHETHPVRFLTASRDGVLAYSWHGQLWTLDAGAGESEPKRIRVECAAGDRANAELVETVSQGATDFAPSPTGDEVAFIVRGDVFVTSAAAGTTRRITGTPEMERSLSWAPDGKALWYAGERGSSWNVYRTSIASKDDTALWNALELSEDAVLATGAEEFQPLVSPDGKSVAYILDRDQIAVLDVATGKSRTIVPAERIYSYADGDVRFAWSPDSRWLAFNFMGGKRWIDDIGVAEVADGKITDLTLSGYEEFAPLWTADGRALLFLTDRVGRRAHGSWGSDIDVFAHSLTQEAFDRARLSREELKLLKTREDLADAAKKADAEAKEKALAEPKKDEKPGDKKDEAPPKPVVIEFEGRERRVRRLTTISGNVSSFAASPDGEVVLLVAEIDGEWSVWSSKPRDGEQKKLLTVDGESDVVFGKDGKTAWVRTKGGAIFKLGLGGLDEAGPVTAERKDAAYSAELAVDLRRERAAIFEHAWRQAGEKFYEAKLHGVDWKRMREDYARLLPQVGNGHEFAELLSEMLGELNASHTGARFRQETPDAEKTAGLGLLWDPAYEGDGVRVAEVIPGGPADRPATKLAPGAVVTMVDGMPIAADMDPARALNRKAGKHVVVSVRAPSGETANERIKAISADEERGLLHERWQRHCDAKVLELSGGRVGWVRVDGMDEDSFRVLFRDALGKHADREALLVDTRWNGGGWLHDDLIGFLGGKEYVWFVPRGKERGSMGGDPARRWSRPSAVLMNEGNYSDAHVFPFAFKELGLGKLVGAPVAGTGTAVWWEGQVDPAIVFGIPQVGLVDARGSYLENQELRPDVEVYCNPADLAKGVDAQLAAAVRVLLAEIEARKGR